jgi:uncharacterized DUF497 family protein
MYIRLEWEERKNEVNQKIHGGIAFEDALLVFRDDSCLIYLDRIDERTGEARWHALGRAGGLAVCLVVHTEESKRMAKNSPGSSQPERLVRVNSEDIGNKPLTERQVEILTRHAAQQAAGDDSDINYSDIPPLTDEQLASMTRLRDRKTKISVSVRLDPQVLDWLKSKVEGHLTRINDILTNLMELETRR